jgi:hypothetical protein
MEAIVRKLYKGYHYVIEGNPDQLDENSKIVGKHATRRGAIRVGEEKGYKIIIKNRAKAATQTKKSSILDKLASSKQRVAEQSQTPQRTLAKSKRPVLNNSIIR